MGVGLFRDGPADRLIPVTDSYPSMSVVSDVSRRKEALHLSLRVPCRHPGAQGTAPVDALPIKMQPEGT